MIFWGSQPAQVLFLLQLRRRPRGSSRPLTLWGDPLPDPRFPKGVTSMSARALSLAILVLSQLPMAAADEPIRFVEDFAPGYQYHVSCRSEITGHLTLPPSKNQ